jgi:hypothetical protein
MMEHHMRGISTTHSDHDKYSMVLACFIVLMVFLIIIMVLLGMSAHRQGSMLNNSNNAMAQIQSLKKALVVGAGAQKMGVSRPNPSSRKGGFNNGMMGTSGARPVGGYIGNISPMNWGSDAGSRMAQVNQGGMSNITGQGLQGTISGDCATGSCNAYDDFMAYSTSTGGMPLPASSAGAEDNENLDFFKHVVGTISGDVTLAQNQIANMQAQRANMQSQRANMQSQRRM